RRTSSRRCAEPESSRRGVALDGGPPTGADRQAVSTLRSRVPGAWSVALAIVAVSLSLAGCSLDAAATCKAAGGTYVGSTCTRSGPREDALRQQCELGGGVYLRGQELCAYGSGGP